MPIFGRSRKTLPIPAILPKTCPKCGRPLKWQPVTIFDTVIGLEKVDYYVAESECGEVFYRDGRGQVVEFAQAENILNHLGDVFVDAQLGATPGKPV